MKFFNFSNAMVLSAFGIFPCTFIKNNQFIVQYNNELRLFQQTLIIRHVGAGFGKVCKILLFFGGAVFFHGGKVGYGVA